MSGLFKSFIDMLDNDLLIALAATAGSVRHALLVDDQMPPLFAYVRAHAPDLGLWRARGLGATEPTSGVQRAATRGSPSSYKPRSSGESPIALCPRISTSSPAAQPAQSKKPPTSTSTRR
jgi:hypothetical protein